MATPGDHSPGVMAQMTGLNGSLDGELGSLVRWTETGRWLVKIYGGRTVAVKTENLRCAADRVPERVRRCISCGLVLTAQVFLELARSGGTRQVTAALVPLLLLAWAVATLWGSKWLYHPLISYGPVPGFWDFTRSPPAQGFFRLGSAVMAMLLVALVRIQRNLILRPVFEETLQYELAMQSSAAGYMAATGLVMQSLFVYRSGVLAPLRTWGVGLFFFGSAWHFKVFVQVSPEFSHCWLAQSTSFTVAVAIRRLLVICAPLAIPNSFVAVPVFKLQAGAWELQSHKRLMRSSAAVSQWVIMLYTMIYFSTYAVDFWIAFEY